MGPTWVYAGGAVPWRMAVGVAFHQGRQQRVRADCSDRPTRPATLFMGNSVTVRKRRAAWRRTSSRTAAKWTDDHTAFQARDLSDSDYVYVWADGVHPKVRLGQDHSCVLVLMGVRPDGRKELIALAEGCVTAVDAGCAIPNSWSVTARWACGGPSQRCFRRPGTRGAGFTRSAMS